MAQSVRVLNCKPSKTCVIRPSPTIAKVLKLLSWKEVRLPEYINEERKKLWDQYQETGNDSLKVRKNPRFDYVPGLEFDLAWVNWCTRRFYQNIRANQKVNHFPGIEELARKSLLAKNLNRLREKFPKDFEFYPDTFVLPEDFKLLSEDPQNRAELDAKDAFFGSTYIVKPSSQCQGRGIRLLRRVEDIDKFQVCVVQRYMENPFLVNKRKFDLRLYALITSADPLRVFLYQDGLVRFCAEPYECPSDANISSDFYTSHLTNYAINKKSANYVANTSQNSVNFGHKWTIANLFELFSSNGFDVENIWHEIRDIVIKTFIGCQPALYSHYQELFPNDVDGARCYQFLGFDVMFDTQMRPWLLEVNRNPSLKMDTPLDKRIKIEALADAFRIVHSQPATQHIFDSLDEKKLVDSQYLKQKNHEITTARIQHEDSIVKLTKYERVFPLLNEKELASKKPHDMALKEHLYYQSLHQHSQVIPHHRSR